MKFPYFQGIFSRIEIGLLQVVCCLLPLIGSSFFVQKKLSEIESLHKRVRVVRNKQSKARSTRVREEGIAAGIQHCDPNYLERVVCLPPLLVTERQKRQMFLAQTGASPTAAPFDSFEGETENRLRFEEVKNGEGPGFREKEWVQKKKVRMNEEDLKRILRLTEGVDTALRQTHPGAPRTVITKFSLQKTGLFDPGGDTGFDLREKSYLIEMKLLTRESLRP